MIPDIILDDEFIIVVNKPAGLLATPPPQDGKEKSRPPVTLSSLVKQYLTKHTNKTGSLYLELIAAPDTETSGIALFSKNIKATQKLKSDIQKLKISFEYWALTANRPKLETGSLVHFLRYAYVKDIMQVFTTHQPNSIKSVLRYEMLAALGNSNLLVLQTFSNHKQQIRAQLARIGTPVRGDKKYGDTKTASAKITYAHLRKITFNHPESNQPLVLSTKIDEKDQLWKTFLHFED